MRATALFKFRSKNYLLKSLRSRLPSCLGAAAATSSAVGTIGFSETTSKLSTTEMDLALVDRDARRNELVVEVVRGDGAEHLAAFARFHGDRDRGLLDLRGQRLRAFDFFRFAESASFLERIDLLAIRMRHRNGNFAGQEIIASVASFDFNLVAFGAETGDRFEEEHFTVSHGNDGLVVLK